LEAAFRSIDMRDVKVLVLSGYGLNCDHETAYALTLAGAVAERVHINSLIDGSVKLSNYRMMALVGGFSWGDDHGAGVIQAVRLKTNLGNELFHFIDAGNLIIGICNGFQTLVNLGLLPGLSRDYETRSVALIYNDCGNFRDQWVTLKVNPASPCIFTRGMDQVELPIRHGEGKFYSDETTINHLADANQIVVQYAMPNGEAANCGFPFNPNGSVRDIAGICDPTGRIFGLMPHPEAFNHYTNHPNWTCYKEQLKRQGKTIEMDSSPGMRLLQNAVDFIRKG
jgi:phosphoribosylformylglycinamidine synthase I